MIVLSKKGLKRNLIFSGKLRYHGRKKEASKSFLKPRPKAESSEFLQDALFLADVTYRLINKNRDQSKI